jgi:hypothetical protein
MPKGWNVAVVDRYVRQGTFTTHCIVTIGEALYGLPHKLRHAYDFGWCAFVRGAKARTEVVLQPGLNEEIGAQIVAE